MHTWLILLLITCGKSSSKHVSSAYNKCQTGLQTTQGNHGLLIITTYIRRLSRQKQRYFNRAHKTNHSDDWKAYNNVKKKTQQKCRRSHNHYVSSLADDCVGVSKKLWSYIKSKRKELMGHCCITIQHTVTV